MKNEITIKDYIKELFTANHLITHAGFGIGEINFTDSVNVNFCK